MAAPARLSRINSIGAPSHQTGRNISTNNDNNDMHTEDSFEDMTSLLSSPRIYTYSDVLAEPDAHNWSNNHTTAQLDEPILVPSPIDSSSDPHAYINDRIHDSTSSLWPVDQWLPPPCITNYGSPESCSFITAVLDSPVHSEIPQHSHITDQNSLSCELNALDISDQSSLSCELNAMSLDTLLQSWTPNISSAEAHDHAAPMAASHDALPPGPAQLQNALLSKMPAYNYLMGMEDDSVATSSSTSEDWIHEFCIESNSLAIEDGYTWRKYGEKNIMGKAYKRAYFRCARSGCIVKKQAEQSSDKEGFVVITYFGKHNHHPTH